MLERNIKTCALTLALGSMTETSSIVENSEHPGLKIFFTNPFIYLVADIEPF